MKSATPPASDAGIALTRAARGKARQLFELLRDEISKQRLKPGDRLPATRKLAKQFGVSRNCVTVAFDMLAADGLVSGRVGAGTFVSGTAAAPDTRSAGHDNVAELLSDWARALPAKPYILAARTARIDFRPGLPNRIGLDACAMPMRRAISRLSQADISAADVNDPAGRMRLRTLIANHLRATRGLPCQASDIVLTSGTHQSLDLIARLFAGRGRKIAVEDPCYPLVPKLFRANGFQVSAVPVDEEGMEISKLAADVKLVYLTPNHQFPLGYRLSTQRREALLELASRQGAFIIEDDYDGELYSVGNLGTGLKADDHQDRVIYLGSFSKYLFPQFRLGFIVAPKSLRDTLIRAKWLTDRQVSLPIQLCLESLLENGDLLKLVRRSERDYTARLELLRQSVERHLAPHFVLPKSAQGFHIVALAVKGFDVAGLVQRALDHGVGIYRLAEFTLESTQDGLIFGLAALSEDEIKEGIRIICSLL